MAHDETKIMTVAKAKKLDILTIKIIYFLFHFFLLTHQMRTCS